jgi:V-type H+-transporting ATPase subunit C
LFYSRGNYYVRDLVDILVEPSVKPSDFIYTKFVNTIVLIVPIGVIQDFLAQYQLWTENVIPGSARRLAVPEKDGLSIW